MLGILSNIAYKLKREQFSTRIYMDKQESASIKDILFTQRFVPECGGVIRWMFEVYGSWPRPVMVYTHDYDRYYIVENQQVRRGEDFQNVGIHHPHTKTHHPRIRTS